MADNIAPVLAGVTVGDPARPLLTWYDDRVGDRTELSGATLGNWVAKTANLLVDSVGLAPDDPVGLLLPPHWQTAAVLLGTLAAGGRPCWDRPEPVEALFVAADRLDLADGWPAGERYVLALAPLAAPVRNVPAGYADYVVEVRGHGDHFRPAAPAQPDLLASATARAAELGVGAGDRVLVDAERHPDPVDWLLAPLAVGASVVLCANLDTARLAERATSERVTRVLA